MKISSRPDTTHAPKGSTTTTVAASIAGAAVLAVGGCYALKRPGAPEMEDNAKNSIEQVFWWYAPTGVSKNPLIDKTQSLFTALKGNTTQRILSMSPTDQWNNNEPEDGVWFKDSDSDTYVTCKTNSETFGPNTITIAAHNVADKNGKPADFTWHISFDDKKVTITNNGKEMRGSDAEKDAFIAKLLHDLKSNF